MGAISLRTTAELRRGWRGAVVLAVLAGIAGGIVVGAFAGARRTGSALDRFVAGTGAQADASVDAATPEQISGLPHVLRVARVTILSLRPPALPEAAPDLAARDSISSVVFDDRSRPFLAGAIVVDGQIPDVHAPNEVAIDQTAVRRRGWKVGDRLTFVIPLQQRDESGNVGPGAGGTKVDLTVTAIVRLPQDLEPVGSGIERPAFRPPDDMWVTPAFLDRHPDAEIFSIVPVWLEHGAADLKAFAASVASASDGKASVSPASFGDTQDVIADSARAVHLQANALRIAAALAAVVVLLATALALSRQIRAGGEEWQTLRTLGMTGTQQISVGFLRGAAVAIFAAAAAVVTAIGLSSMFPFGFARQAETHLGRRADVPVLVAGAAAIVLILGAWSAFSAWRLVASTSAHRGVGSASRRLVVSRLTSSIRHAGAPTTAVVGVGMALETRHGASPVPVRVALATMTAVIAAVIGVLVFATSLDHLVATPSLQGWRWDALVFGGDHQVGEQLANDPAATAVARGTLSTIRVEGRETAALALSPLIGSDFQIIVEGRPPSGARDIALGAKTMQTLGVSIGDRVSVEAGKSPQKMLVVGRAVMPSALGFPGMSLAEGAVLTGPLEVDQESASVSFAAVRFKPGTDVAAHTKAFGSTNSITKNPRSAEVENLRRVSGIPRILAALLGIIAAATIFHLLVTTMHRRRRELAVLRVLGFRSHQVASTLSWQASTITAVSVILGIPLGIAIGRWAWHNVAHSLGVSAAPVTPTAALLAIGVSAVVLASLMTWIPARLAARVPTAEALDSE